MALAQKTNRRRIQDNSQGFCNRARAYWSFGIFDNNHYELYLSKIKNKNLKGGKKEEKWPKKIQIFWAA